MDGKSVVIGGREFVVPRMRVLTYERVMLAFEDLEKSEGDANGVRRLGALCGAILEILSRNYPELTLDEVKGLVDVSEIDETLSTLMTAAGRKERKPEGEAVSP